MVKNRLVQYHEPAREPSDAEAVLEWGLNTPFTSQDKPPLAIAMVVTLNGVRSLRRYRLVIAQKSKLRLAQEVTAALASQSRDHRLTASGFFPCSIDREYLYGYAGDGYRSPLWLCASHNGSPVLVHLTWKQTATLCPLDWPSNYSLLRLWHMTKSFQQYAAQLKQQIQRTTPATWCRG